MNPGRHRQAGVVNTTWLIVLFLGLLIACWPAGSVAQDNTTNAVRLTDSGNRIVYRLRYFDFENVSNLEQLLDQIPDLQYVLDDSLRDSEYRVLINGNVAGSAPRDLRDIGRRFSLADIRRIVILRGPTALERVGVSGPAINIVLKADADLSVGRWEANIPLVSTEYAVPNLRISYSDRPADWTYEVFADYLPNANYRPRTRKETYLDPDDLQPTQQRLTRYNEHTEQYALGGLVNWQLGDRLNLRADSRLSERRKTRIQERWIDGQENSNLTGLKDDRRLYELGLAAVFQLTPASIWETLFERIEERRDRVITTGIEGERGLIVSSATRHEDQRLVFSSVINSVTENGSEYSLGVYARPRSRDALSAVSLDPLLMETEAEINEDRTGLVANYNWQSRPDIKLFASLDIENWHLKQQNGPFSRNDREIFVKPAFNLRWKFASKSVLRVSGRRHLRSLNFDQMVFNFNLEDEIVDTGNLSMVPEKYWLGTVFVEQRVFDQKGRLGLGAFYRMIEDHIDREPRPGGSGPGNIGDAYARGMQLTGRYEVLRNSGMYTVVKADFTLQESEVTDPFTGEDRPLRGFPDKIFKLELRQEFLRASLDYVLDMTWTSDRYYSDHNYREIRSLNRPIANLKANYQVSDNLQVWLEIRGLFDLDEYRSREKFAGDPSLGQLRRIEQSLYLEERQFAVGVLGYF